MSSTDSKLVAVLGLALASGVFGCGQTGPAYPTARLEGQFRIDGAPVASGSLQFMPLEKSQPAWAQVKDGHYVAPNVPVGKVRVLFTALRETGKMENDGAHQFPELVNLIPARFRTGTELEVTGDNPSQDFLLFSR